MSVKKGKGVCMKRKWFSCISKILVFTLVLGMFTGLVDNHSVNAMGNTYYVSPRGFDTNPGTEAQPWKTLAKAAANLKAGDTAVFEDGVYDQTRITSFAYSGTEGAPITIKARNKHKAVLKYSGLSTTSKILLQSRQYIVIQDFEITQDVKGASSSDMFIDARDSSNCSFIGNYIHNAFGKGIRCLKGENITIEHNYFNDISGEGMRVDNIDSAVVSNNEVYEVGNVGIILAAGSRGARIFNNYIHSKTVPMKYAIILGGSSPASAAYDPEGFEAFNSVAWNNLVISEEPSRIEYALSFIGSTNSAFFNNIVVGAGYGTFFGQGGSGTWRPVPTNSEYMNNIFMNVEAATKILAEPLHPMNDYNLYFNCAGAPHELNGVYEDPGFADKYTDWTLNENSPAIGAGTPVAFTGFNGETIDVSLDFTYTQRVEPWDMGIYAVAHAEPTPTPSPSPTPGNILFSDDFEGGPNWDVLSGNWSIVEDLDGNKVYTQPDASAESGLARAVAGSAGWQSYVLETNVKFNQFFNKSGYLTLYTRFSDTDNYYLLEMKGSPETSYIALKKKVGGTVVPLQEKSIWQPALEEWHTIKFVVNGNKMEVYINDQLELSGTDNKLRTGCIAAAIYRADVYVDDVVVTKIDADPYPEEPDVPKAEPGGTYYVSPEGSDDNPGTEQAPWKTMTRVAASIQRGSTVIFEDGEYIETQPAIFEESGTEAEPIIIKARNKHKAVIKYQNMPTIKIRIKGQKYITLQDFEITQDFKGIDTNDILVQVREGADHCKIIGNKIHNAYEEGVKAYLVENVLIEGNYIYDMVHEGVDFVNVASSTIRNNEVYDVGRVGLLCKGGSYDIQIHGNYVHNRNVPMSTSGIYLGGMTGADSTADSSINGYEAYNCVAYNNVVISESPGLITLGIAFAGSINCAAYNNIVSGAKYNMYFAEPNNISAGWEWNPQNVNPVFKNNIIINATLQALMEKHPAINRVNDHNLYYNNASTPSESNGVYADPLIADIDSGNWHICYGSPAIGAGTPITGFTLRSGQIIDISRDFDGIQRTEPWDMGVYDIAYVNGEEVLSFIEDTHASGTVGLYAFKDTVSFDNVQVRLIDNAPPHSMQKSRETGERMAGT